MTSEDDVRSLLAALPSPDMPESVAQAITARLADEAGTPSGSTADVVALTPRSDDPSPNPAPIGVSRERELRACTLGSSPSFRRRVLTVIRDSM